VGIYDITNSAHRVDQESHDSLPLSEPYKQLSLHTAQASQISSGFREYSNIINSGNDDEAVDDNPAYRVVFLHLMITLFKVIFPFSLSCIT
jgi:hypothetical protein